MTISITTRGRGGADVCAIPIGQPTSSDNMHFSYTVGGGVRRDVRLPIEPAVLAGRARDGCKNDVVKLSFPALTDPRYPGGFDAIWWDGRNDAGTWGGERGATS